MYIENWKKPRREFMQIFVRIVPKKENLDLVYNAHNI